MTTSTVEKPRQSVWAWLAFIVGALVTFGAWSGDHSFVGDNHPVVMAYLVATVALLGTVGVTLSGTAAGRANAAAAAKGLFPAVFVLLALRFGSSDGTAVAAIGLLALLIAVVIARMLDTEWPEPPAPRQISE